MNLVTTGDSLTRAAKNIRIELKHAFPGVTFSVKSKRFSMGDDITIHWTDGPTGKAVNHIVGKYEAGSFDGMVDLYTYAHSEFTNLYGDAKYIMTTRHYSDSAIQDAITEIAAKWDDNPVTWTADDFNMGRLYVRNPSRHCDDYQHLIYGVLGVRDFTQTVQAQAA